MLIIWIIGLMTVIAKSWLLTMCRPQPLWSPSTPACQPTPCMILPSPLSSKFAPKDFMIMVNDYDVIMS